MTGWRLLLTRPTEESAALGTVLADAGIFSSSLPLLEIEPTAPSDTMRGMVQQLDRYCAAIVVSKPAARIVTAMIQQQNVQAPNVHWFSVGAATARILEDQGLMVHCPDEGDDSEALLAMPELREAVGQADSRVLIVRGEGGRELLAEHLRESGAGVEYLELYRRALPHYPPAALARRIEAERLNGLVVSSGQGFEHLQQLAGDAWPQLARMPLFVPSPRVAELARAAGAQTVVDCRGASAAALLTALREHPEPVL